MPIHQSDRPDDEVCRSVRDPVVWSGCRARCSTPRKLRWPAWPFDVPLVPEEHHRADARESRRRIHGGEERKRYRPHHRTGHPRTRERVPAGARFNIRLVMDVLCDEDAPLFQRVLEGLRFLEDDSLGGGGSRGSGRVSLANLGLAARQERRRFGCSGERISAGVTWLDPTGRQESAFGFIRED